LTLEDIVTQLDERKQRATYGAVVELVDACPRWLMKGRARCPRYSWVVAKKSGSPTGYAEWQIHPDCLGQIRQRLRNVIKDGDSLKRWLEPRAG
jgi:hypothetical protein